MSEPKTRTARVVDLGEDWKNAIQGRMGSNRQRREMKKEADILEEKSSIEIPVKEENKMVAPLEVEENE